MDLGPEAIIKTGLLGQLRERKSLSENANLNSILSKNFEVVNI